MYFNAKDDVSGDFPWLLRKGDVVYLRRLTVSWCTRSPDLFCSIRYFLLFLNGLFDQMGEGVKIKS